MSWAESLIKLSSYEVELLQKRLSEIVDRRADAEMRIVMLEAQGEAETARAREDAGAAWHLTKFMDGLRQRKAAIHAEIDLCLKEEAGARDALALAFEEQKKYEHVAESARLLQMKEMARRETAMLDELGLRRAAGGR
jgi:flagellar FliJ protein